MTAAPTLTEMEARLAAAKIALTAIQAMIAFHRYLGSAECDAATADAEAELAARRPVTPGPFGWADDAAEYYGGGSID